MLLNRLEADLLNSLPCEKASLYLSQYRLFEGMESSLQRPTYFLAQHSYYPFTSDTRMYLVEEYTTYRGFHDVIGISASKNAFCGS